MNTDTKTTVVTPSQNNGDIAKDKIEGVLSLWTVFSSIGMLVYALLSWVFQPGTVGHLYMAVIMTAICTFLCTAALFLYPRYVDERRKEGNH